MVSISVAGTASRTVPAERGTLRMSVRADREDAGSAVADAAALQADLLVRARDAVAAGAATRWTADQVTVTTEREWIREGEQRIRQVAAAAVEVRFQDFTALGRWATEAGAVEGVAIERTDWSLTDATRADAERTARLDAVADALVRARDYARALGAEDVVVQRLAEPGTAPQPLGWQPQGRAVARAMSARAEPFELSPRGIEVSATVLLEAVTA